MPFHMGERAILASWGMQGGGIRDGGGSHWIYAHGWAYLSKWWHSHFQFALPHSSFLAGPLILSHTMYLALACHPSLAVRHSNKADFL
jgi:hypothetical protein